MTVAVKDNFGHGGGRKPLARGKPGANPWRRLWQVPLLLIGLAAFAVGMQMLVKAIKPVPFAEQAKGVRVLMEQGEFAKAIEQINVLGDYYKDAASQGELQVLAGDAHYLAQQREPAPVRENFKRVTEHYRRAVGAGVKPTVQMNERWGESALALGDAKLAIEKLEAAIAAAQGISAEEGGRLAKKYAQDLVAAYMETGKGDGKQALEQRAKAVAVVDRMVAADDASPDKEMRGIKLKAWGLCKRIEIALVGLPAGESEALERVIGGARQSLESLEDADAQGRVLGWIGRAELERGEAEKAETDLAAARSHFAVHHEEDGRASILLARIAQKRGDLERARSLFEDVVVRHAGTKIWAAARLGRSMVAAMQGTALTPEMLKDYRYCIKAVATTSEAAPAAPEGEPVAVGQKAELITPTDVKAALGAGFDKATSADRLDDALMYLALQREMGDHETEALAFQWATTKERRAAELTTEAARAKDPAVAEEKEKQASRLYGEAAADYLRHAKLTTLDDTISGNSLWRAGELYDLAGQTMEAVGVFDRFTIQRPRDARVSDGLLAIGRLYESAGMVEKAIPIYQRNINENPRTPAAYRSAVNMSRCYQILGDASAKAGKKEQADREFNEAEKVLLSLVQNNQDIQPAAREFRDSLLLLGELYFREGRWPESVLRFQEVVDRYPSDKLLPRALFLLAESYRKNAGAIDEAIRTDSGLKHQAELRKARGEQLLKAAGLFNRVIAMLDAEVLGDRSVTPSAGDQDVVKIGQLELDYLRSSYMERAACYFDRGEYEIAIKLYDQAAARFSEEVDAAQAYVQIVNAYLALGSTEQAARAAERGQWVLKRIPDDAFRRVPTELGRDYYEKLLNLGKS